MTAPDTHHALASVVDTPSLPRVLLIGDSISMGYTPPVRALLAGRASVHRPPENCAQSAVGVAKLDVWLGTEPWDVIHFNFGLHDIKHVTPDNLLAVPPESGAQIASLGDYENNLRQIVARLKQTDAALLWASTTPVPYHANGRIEGSEIAYNDVAEYVMEENGVAINDLWSLARARQDEIQKPHDVHFTPDGYTVLARAVATAIEMAGLQAVA